MPHSFASVAVHFVFSTKERAPWIDNRWESELFAFIGGVVRSKGSTMLTAGGVADHVHLLISLGREVSLAEMMRLIKANSSKWVHEAYPDTLFAWQAGYGAFAVSYSRIEAVRDYIARQKERHATQSYQDEYRALLQKHGLQWDERYVWD
jgi:putative transposase